MKEEKMRDALSRTEAAGACRQLKDGDSWWARADPGLFH